VPPTVRKIIRLANVTSAKVSWVELRLSFLFMSGFTIPLSLSGRQLARFHDQIDTDANGYIPPDGEGRRVTGTTIGPDEAEIGRIEGIGDRRDVSIFWRASVPRRPAG
jgi:hypothetical protein